MKAQASDARSGWPDPARGQTQHHACHRTLGSTYSAAAVAADKYSTPVAGSSRGAAPSMATPGSSGSKQGRRARRKEKQASADARARLMASP
jgi:hypothetical protein